MPPTIRTRQQLLDLFIVNGIGAIVPGDDDDFIASTFGYYSLPRDPSPLDDSNNSGGTGQYFDTGSRWMNTTTGQWFKCQSGAVGAAIWTGQAYDGQPAGGRLTGTWPTPVLTLTGVVAGSYGDSSHYATFTVAADGTLTAAAEYPFPPGGVTIPTAQFRVVAGTTLAGTYSIGIFPLSVGDRLLTWDGIDQSTWGIWIVQTGSWTRAPEMPAGTVFNGPAYVWIASDEEFFPAYPSLFTLEPLPWGPGTNPGSWTLGVDHVVCCFASPTSVVTAVLPIAETRIYGREGPAEYELSWAGPVTLDQWAAYGPAPLSPANIGSGPLPSVTISVAQLTVGVWPVTVFVPYTQISGAPGPGGMVTEPPATTTITTTDTVIWNVTVADGIWGWLSIKNLGAVTITLTFDYIDCYGLTQGPFTHGLAPGSNNNFPLEEVSASYGGSGLGLAATLQVSMHVGVGTATIDARFQHVS